MHVVVLPAWYPRPGKDVGGIFFREQVKALMTHERHKVGVIVPEMRSIRRIRKLIGGINGLKKTVEDGAPTYRYFGYQWFGNIPWGQGWNFLRGARKLLKIYIADHGRPDVLFVQSALLAGYAAAKLKQEFGIPYVLMEPRSFFVTDRASAGMHRLAHAAFAGASSILPCSPFLGEALERDYPDVCQKWTWMPYIVDTDRFDVVATSRPVDRPITFLNVALMGPRKGQKDLLRAFAQAFGHRQDVQLRFASGGPLEQELKNMAQSLGISQQVVFLGGTAPDKLIEEYQNCDVFVFPSVFETFGVVVVEALACGKPVVTTRCGGPEYLVSEKSGIVLEPGDVDGLAAAMKTLATTYPSYDAQWLRADCSQRFGSRSVAKRMTEEFRSCVESYQKCT